MPIGTEKPLKLSQIKDFYHKLGFYLHIPTIAQSREGLEQDLGRLRATVRELLQALEYSLGSTMWDLVLPRGLASIDCIRCGASIRRRLNSLDEPGAPPAASKSLMKVECFKCDATYTLRLSGDGEVEWLPHAVDRACLYEGCDGIVEIWEADMQAGRTFKCPKCDRELRLILGLTRLEAGGDSRESS